MFALLAATHSENDLFAIVLLRRQQQNCRLIVPTRVAASDQNMKIFQHIPRSVSGGRCGAWTVKGLKEV